MGTEIIINPQKIMQAEEKLKALQSNLVNRKVNITFDVSKGDTVTELQELAKKMEDAKNAIALLCGNTASALMATRTSFNETDNSIANYFESFGESIDEKED